MKILVVDDELVIQNLARVMLERNGHTVLTVESGEEALEALKSEPENIDIVLLDWNLKGMSGPATLREIRRLIPDCPAIFSSGQQITDYDIPEDLIENTHVLMKPYRSAALIEMIQQALHRTRTE